MLGLLSHLPVPGAQPGDDCGQAGRLLRRPLAIQQRLALVPPLVLRQAPGRRPPASQVLRNLIPLRSTAALLEPGTSHFEYPASPCPAAQGMLCSTGGSS